MSLLLLIDGYNVVAPIAAPGRAPDPHWLQRERRLLLQRLVQHLTCETRQRTCVVFDAAHPPLDRPDRFTVDGIEIMFAVGYPEADDLLEELIAVHSAAKQLTVVSSDHRVQLAARRRGATAFDSAEWLDRLLDGRVALAIDSSPTGSSQPDDHKKPSEPIDSQEIQHWMREFGFDPEER